MLIKYDPELIQFEDQADTLEGEVKVNNSTFDIVVLATDLESSYATLYGNFDNFHTLNSTNGIDNTPCYEVIDRIPTVGVEYSFDVKHGTPKDVNEAIKYKTRSRIENEIGDNEDLIADLSKRITMLERLVIRMTNEVMTNAPDMVPTIIAMYKPMVDGYLYIQEQYNNVTNIADLEDPNELFQKLIERSIKLTNIVSSDYLDKKI